MIVKTKTAKMVAFVRITVEALLFCGLALPKKSNQTLALKNIVIMIIKYYLQRE